MTQPVWDIFGSICYLDVLLDFFGLASSPLMTVSDSQNPLTGQWSCCPCRPLLDCESIAWSTLSSSWPLSNNSSGTDRLVSKLTSNGVFSVKFIKEYLHNINVNTPNEDPRDFFSKFPRVSSTKFKVYGSISHNI